MKTLLYVLIAFLAFKMFAKAQGVGSTGGTLADALSISPWGSSSSGFFSPIDDTNALLFSGIGAIDPMAAMAAAGGARVSYDAFAPPGGSSFSTLWVDRTALETTGRD